MVTDVENQRYLGDWKAKGEYWGIMEVATTESRHYPQGWGNKGKNWEALTLEGQAPQS